MGRACPRALNAALCTVWHGLDRINDRVYARRTTSLLSNHHDNGKLRANMGHRVRYILRALDRYSRAVRRRE